MVVGIFVHLQEQRVTIQPPTTPGGPVIVTQTPVITGVPQTSAEYRAVMAMRETLSEQLVSVAGRRSQLAEELKTADALARPGIQDRLKVLDARIVRLEGEIDRTGDLVARTSPLQRLEQMQQSIDAIAIEVERISEGQRFVSRILSDRSSHGIGAGAADPLRASMKAAIPSERG